MSRILVDNNGQLAQYRVSITSEEVDMLIDAIQRNENYVSIGSSTTYDGFIRKNKKPEVSALGDREVYAKTGFFSYTISHQRNKYAGALAFLRDLQKGRELDLMRLFDNNIIDEISITSLEKCADNPFEMMDKDDVSVDRSKEKTRIEEMKSRNPSVIYFIDNILDSLNLSQLQPVGLEPSAPHSAKIIAMNNTRFLPAARTIRTSTKVA